MTFNMNHPTVAKLETLPIRSVKSSPLSGVLLAFSMLLPVLAMVAFS